MEKKTIVMGVIGADVHAIGNKILYYCFVEAASNASKVASTFSLQSAFIPKDSSSSTLLAKS